MLILTSADTILPQKSQSRIFIRGADVETRCHAVVCQEVLCVCVFMSSLSVVGFPV